MTTQTSTDPQVETLPKTQAQRPICCGKCAQVVASRKNRRDREHTFRNPAGYSFHVVCFEKAEGCSLVGEAVREGTWFEGYAWTLAMCSDCGGHLGWSFGDGDETSFFGLIATRLKGL